MWEIFIFYTHFQVTHFEPILRQHFISIPSENVRKSEVLTFLGGIEMEHWLEMS